MWPDGLSVYPPLLLAVLLLHRLLPLPDAYHPLTALRFLCRQLGNKVNPDPNRPRQQLYISGTLALLVFCLPFIALGYALYAVSELPYALDALLLYLSLDWQNQRGQAMLVQQQLQAGQLSLARQSAKPLLLRQCQTLSAMGLSKAVIESLVLRASTSLIGVLCYFLLGAGLAAFSYRLLLLVQQQWNCKLPTYRYFGRPAAMLIRLLNTPPQLLCILILAIQHGIKRCYHQARQPRLNINLLSFWLLGCASVALQRSLGGPVYYQQPKISRSRLTQRHEPEAADIAGAAKMLAFMQGLLLLLLLAFGLLQWVLTLR
ncbi:cobalamin biosynthesis protein CobD/CbiB [Rheinheimera nanhaiensis]|uniref:Adenosylcobinamide-phosphate synthase n=1 Tax=Rheinheimera nanhaiensis E407-8 TaxID=562729 RepID=I1E291_9GAMM|nr:cobalamin biosynthesis protein [Rheinheimera nanhaiensis]GAB60419.1 adenosylcobinamide-phosphate synthase [Rheinheimera nanhaiensis E407-8]